MKTWVLVAAASCAAVGAGFATGDDTSVDSRSPSGAQPPSRVVVVVRDGRGAPVDGAHVVVHPNVITGIGDPPPVTAVATSTGRYEAEVVGGDRRVTATAGPLTGTLTFHVDPGARKKVTLIVR